MSFFLKDLERGQCVSWDNLISDIKNVDSYNPYCYKRDYYSIFKTLIISLLLDKEIILIDYDFSDSELNNLTGKIGFEEFNKSLNYDSFSHLTTKDELLRDLNAEHKNWRITLFTSGTTGVPKKVSHSFNSITRFVRYSKSRSENIWGFAYNPTHMAGVQVFLQSVLNGSSIVRLFGLNFNDILSELSINKVTHISATPTFYKLLLPTKFVFENVERVTLGGEKFNNNVFENLKFLFPNAKVNNIYASTEVGSLFVSNNDVFSIQPNLNHLIKIEENQILVHSSLLGNTDFVIDEWYPSGDIVEIVSTDPVKFRFLNRNNELINIGGYKVNPNEVEDSILTLKGIRNVRVFSKANSILGNVLCCEIVLEDSSITELLIRNYLKSKLQEFKIPRFISFVKEITLTRSGKLKRYQE